MNDGLSDLLRDDPLLDTAWYLARYPDVAGTGLTAEQHYLAIGAELGRDPGPAFCTTAYLAANPDVAAAGLNPLVHYVQSGRREGRPTRPGTARCDVTPGPPMTDAGAPALPGALARRAGARLVLVVGHAAGPVWFGAERSLLALLASYHRIGIDTALVLPAGADTRYVEAAQALTTAVHFATVPFRRPRHDPDTGAVAHAHRLIADTGADAVQTNTVVPREALLAARRAGIPAVVFAREIPTGDRQLEEWLGAPADEIVASVAGDADYLLTTSRAAADTYPMAGRTAVVPPPADEHLLALGPPRPDGPLRVALVGSVQEKKGVADFVALAALLADRTDIVCRVIGPLTPYAHRLLAAGVPGNLEFAGAADDPPAALALADVVVNLSTCEEAFSRTMLEAMAAGLPAVGWDRGAIPEVVVDGVTGYVVPFGDLPAMAHRLRWLRDPAVRRRLGDAGRARAQALYSSAAADAALATAWSAILPTADVLAERAGDRHLPLPTNHRAPHARPFYAGNRSRWAHCTAVAFAGPDLLVTASLLGQEAFVVSVDPASGEAAIVGSLPTTADGVPASVDLLDVTDGKVVAANCESQGVTVLRLDGHALRHEGSIRLPGGGFAHGAAWVPGRPGTPGLAAVATNTGAEEVAFVSTVSGAQIASFRKDGWVMKDVAFADPARMVVAMMRQPLDQDPATCHQARLVLVALGTDLADQQVLDEVDLPASTADGCCVHGHLALVADQARDAVHVYDVAGDRLQHVRTLRGFSLPHDVAVSPDGRWIAVANYGTNTVTLRPWPEDLDA
ncbi:MAG: glycosyltransferase family 4 protein [Acidimicrobiaceae bacterium]|nr:glycosyltransferase family 4 protein [Ilumatobacter sp.]MCB9382467.1 glycosyltransferase family 4 protein [Acidimicrobiaceae bacterium]MCO5329775.1 glycosyltransferase family 4 protein [Ilumatobacteraceae bacterium]